jgi:hypothetical protein
MSPIVCLDWLGMHISTRLNRCSSILLRRVDFLENSIVTSRVLALQNRRNVRGYNPLAVEYLSLSRVDQAPSRRGYLLSTALIDICEYTGANVPHLVTLFP